MIKPIKLFTIFICIFSFSQYTMAQLSVRNSAYIFVKDEIVFVEDDINLEETASTIYLRTEAQIIQGTGTTSNTGEGELSVYQDGNVGAYEYNYWCSPTGSHDDTMVNNPFGISLLNDIVDLTNSIPAGVTHQTGYNGSSSPLAIEPYWIWTYPAGTDYTGWIYAGDATIIPAGYGFSMKGTAGSGDNQNYDFRGKPNNGTINIPVTNGSETLVGNPYPSAMDAHAYIWDADNRTVFDGVLRYWEQDPTIDSHNLASYDGGYTTYTIEEFSPFYPTILPAVFKTYNTDGTEVGNSGTTNTGKIPERYIPIGQGFMILANANGTLRAKNSHRVYEKESGGNSAFFKSANSKVTNTENSIFTTVGENTKRFRLNISFNNLYSRQLVETFNDRATEGFDRGLEIRQNEDAKLPSDAYWPMGEHAYLAEALPFNEDMRIPLTIKVNNDMPVTISVVDVQNFDSDSTIFIHDKLTGEYFDLNTANFSTNLETGNYTERFEVTFKPAATLDTDEYSISSLDAIQNNTSNILTLFNPNSLNIKSIYVYDATGKQVLTERPINTASTYELPTNKLSTGIYIVKATLDNATTFSKKVIIN